MPMPTGKRENVTEYARYKVGNDLLYARWRNATRLCLVCYQRGSVHKRVVLPHAPKESYYTRNVPKITLTLTLT